MIVKNVHAGLQKLGFWFVQKACVVMAWSPWAAYSTSIGRFCVVLTWTPCCHSLEGKNTVLFPQLHWLFVPTAWAKRSQQLIWKWCKFKLWPLESYKPIRDSHAAEQSGQHNPKLLNSERECASVPPLLLNSSHKAFFSDGARQRATEGERERPGPSSLCVLYYVHRRSHGYHTWSWFTMSLWFPMKAGDDFPVLWNHWTHANPVTHTRVKAIMLTLLKVGFLLN